MNNGNSIKQAVRDYIMDEFLVGEQPDALIDSTPLVSGGILDSIATVKLVTFLEDTFKIEFEPHEMGTDHLDSLTQIVETVQSKLSAARS